MAKTPLKETAKIAREAARVAKDKQQLLTKATKQAFGRGE